MAITLGQNDNTGINMGAAAPLQNAAGNLGGGTITIPQVEGSATTIPNGTGGGSGSTTPAHDPLNIAAVQNTQKSLDQLPAILAAALAASRQEYDNANQGFGVQEQQQRGQYDTGTVTNQQNYDANLMAALRSGASGLGGLLSILRGTGAEGWAKNAVADTTNNDIRTGLDTQKQNQGQLDTSLSTFLTDLAGKRHANDQTLQNNEYAARGNNATQMQDLYKTMAGFYSDAGDTGNATNWMNRAGDQSGDIARFGTAPVSKFDTTPVPVKSADVTAFADPTQQAITATNANTPNGSAGLFTIGDTRRRLAGAGA